MTLMEKLQRVVTKHPKVDYFFTYLYYTKRYCLMLENLEGEGINSFSKEQQILAERAFKKITTLGQLTSNLYIYMITLAKAIPEDRLEEWNYAANEVFTDKYHHRRFWNEIENPLPIDLYVMNFCRLFTDSFIYTDDNFNNNCKWNLRISDLNNLDLYFESQEDLEKFTNNFMELSYCVFKKDTNGWITWYSV